jgi:predicted GIY-YIG superfamily endonuclease
MPKQAPPVNSCHPEPRFLRRRIYASWRRVYMYPGCIDPSAHTNRGPQDDRAMAFPQNECLFITDNGVTRVQCSQVKRMPTQKIYFVYIMTNRSKTLYVGVTNSLIRRVHEHKLGIGSMFTNKYKLDRLVYYERYEDVHRANRPREAN